MKAGFWRIYSGFCELQGSGRVALPVGPRPTANACFRKQLLHRWPEYRQRQRRVWLGVGKDEVVTEVREMRQIWPLSKTSLVETGK